MEHIFRVPRSELENRISKVQAGLERDGIDVAVVIQNVDLYYLTGTIQQGHLLVPASGHPVHLVRKSLDRAREESALPDVRPMKRLADLEPALRTLGFSDQATVGLELDVLPVNLFRRYQTLLPGARLVDCSPVIREVRAVKSAFEVGLIEEAGRQSHLIYQEAARVLREGMTEIELAAHLERVVRRAGHHGFVRFRAFNQELYHGHLISGPNGAVASHLDTPLAGRGLTPAVAQGAGYRAIRRSEPVVMDLSGGVHGYLSDQTRVFSVGPLSQEFKDAYQVCRDIQELVISKAVAGVPCGDLYSAAVEYARSAGLADNFMGKSPNQVSFIGHGVGLEIDEMPYLSRGNTHTLSEGNVIAVEPKLAFPKRGAVGVENTWLVGQDRPRALTITTDDIIEVD
ncbi:MAG: aminopeptidase P family protein [Actinobacteria bacterium]|nr:aminopeptidase P family protein [Actinomycetota bacterium]